MIPLTARYRLPECRSFIHSRAAGQPLGVTCCAELSVHIGIRPAFIPSFVMSAAQPRASPSLLTVLWLSVVCCLFALASNCFAQSSQVTWQVRSATGSLTTTNTDSVQPITLQPAGTQLPAASLELNSAQYLSANEPYNDNLIYTGDSGAVDAYGLAFTAVTGLISVTVSISLSPQLHGQSQSDVYQAYVSNNGTGESSTTYAGVDVQLTQLSTFR